MLLGQIALELGAHGTVLMQAAKPTQHSSSDRKALTCLSHGCLHHLPEKLHTQPSASRLSIHLL